MVAVYFLLMWLCSYYGLAGERYFYIWLQAGVAITLMLSLGEGPGDLDLGIIGQRAIGVFIGAGVAATVMFTFTRDNPFKQMKARIQSQLEWVSGLLTQPAARNEKTLMEKLLADEAAISASHFDLNFYGYITQAELAAYQAVELKVLYLAQKARQITELSIEHDPICEALRASVVPHLNSLAQAIASPQNLHHLKQVFIQQVADYESTMLDSHRRRSTRQMSNATIMAYANLLLLLMVMMNVMKKILDDLEQS